jgi:hypothetical protein
MNANKKFNKSSVSDAKSYQEMGEYWDTHDLSEVWDQTEPAEFAVDAPSRATYYPVESTLSQKLHTPAVFNR